MRKPVTGYVFPSFAAPLTTPCLGEQTYTWNLAGWLEKGQYPSGQQVTACYDVAGRALTVTGTKSGNCTNYAGGAPSSNYPGIGYGLDGQLASAAFGIVSGPPAVSETRNYSLDRLQLTGITATNGQGTELLALGFTWGGLPTYNNTPGNNGNLQQQTIQVPAVTHTQQYGYDTANRILSANESEQLTNGGTTHPWGMSFGFDPYGNHWSSTTGITLSPAGPTSQSQFNPSDNQLVGDGYDSAGHLTSDPNLGNVTYYAEGQQYTVTNAGNVGTYYYDAEGRRVQRLVSGTVSGTAAYVYDAAGRLTAEYSNLPDTDTGTGTEYLTADHLGSTRLVTNSSGQCVARMDYYLFGGQILNSAADGNRDLECNGTTNEPLKFTGKERDAETGLDYFGARYISSAQGRFTSPDPKLLPSDFSNPQRWNKYAYALNNPLRYVDPDGADSQDWFVIYPGYVKSGGDRAWRDNNPGNVMGGAWSTAHGAVGQDEYYNPKTGRTNHMAIFPTMEAGLAAQEANWMTPTYQNMTLLDAIKAYAPVGDDGNDPTGYAASLASLDFHGFPLT